MRLRWSDQRRCPRCHTYVPEGAKRCPEHPGVDAYWTSRARVSPPGAPRRRVLVGTKGTLKLTDLDSLKAVVEARFDVQGNYREPASEHFGPYMIRWHEARRQELSDSYHRIVGYLIGKHIEGTDLGATQLGSVDRTMLRSFAGALEEKGLSPKSRANIMGLIRRALQDAIDEGRIDGPNPADRTASAPVTPGRKLTVWTSEQLSTFLGYVERTDAETGSNWYPIFRLVAASGLRRGEALGVSWANVDLDKGRLRVEQSLSSIRDGKPILKAPKTKNGVRTIGLEKATVETLREWRRTQLGFRMAMGADWPSHDLVFTDGSGQPIRLERTTRTFKRMVRGLDGQVPAIRLHDLRHGAVSHLAHLGMPLHSVSKLMGHHSAAFTADVYGHLFDDDSDRMAALMEGVLDA